MEIRRTLRVGGEVKNYNPMNRNRIEVWRAPSGAGCWSWYGEEGQWWSASLWEAAQDAKRTAETGVVWGAGPVEIDIYSEKLDAPAGAWIPEGVWIPS